MSCILFAEMENIFQFKKTLKNTGKWKKKIVEKIRGFCQTGKVGTMSLFANQIIQDCGYFIKNGAHSSGSTHNQEMV